MNASELIDAIGGTSKVADICGLTTGAISQWRTKGIPKPWLKFFAKAYPKAFKQAQSKKAA